MRATNVNLTNLKVMMFPLSLYLTVYSALFTLFTLNYIHGLVVSVDDSCFGGREFKLQKNLLLC